MSIEASTQLSSLGECAQFDGQHLQLCRQQFRVAGRCQFWLSESSVGATDCERRCAGSNCPYTEAEQTLRLSAAGRRGRIWPLRNSLHCGLRSNRVRMPHQPLDRPGASLTNPVCASFAALNSLHPNWAVIGSPRCGLHIVARGRLPVSAAKGPETPPQLVLRRSLRNAPGTGLTWGRCLRRLHNTGEIEGLVGCRANVVFFYNEQQTRQNVSLFLGAMRGLRLPRSVSECARIARFRDSGC
jgi:hypothetical protein